METVSKSLKLRKLGEKIIKEHADLRWIKDCRIRVGYCESDLDKRKGSGPVYAECHKVRPLYQAYIPYDFLIVFYTPNSDLMTDEQRDILMYHELLHIGMDSTGTLRLVPHDIEDFWAIIDHHGMQWDQPEEQRGADLYGP